MYPVSPPRPPFLDLNPNLNPMSFAHHIHIHTGTIHVWGGGGGSSSNTAAPPSSPTRGVVLRCPHTTARECSSRGSLVIQCSLLRTASWLCGAVLRFPYTPAQECRRAAFLSPCAQQAGYTGVLSCVQQAGYAEQGRGESIEPKPSASRAGV